MIEISYAFVAAGHRAQVRVRIEDPQPAPAPATPAAAGTEIGRAHV